MSGISYWYSNSEPAQQVRDEFFRNTADNTANGLAIYYLPVDNGHLTLDYETVLQKGINGILCEAEGFAQNAPPEKHTFYAAAISGLNAYKRLAERFSALAARKSLRGRGRGSRAPFNAFPLDRARSRAARAKLYGSSDSYCLSVFHRPRAGRRKRQRIRARGSSAFPLS